MSDEVALVVARVVEKLEPLHREVNEAYWDLATTSAAGAAARQADREKPLRAEVFRPGRTLPWGDLVRSATGAPLESGAWVDQFVRDPQE